MNTKINDAIEVIKSGGVAVFPTDTVYGIGCRLDNADAIKKVFTIRNRAEEKAVLAVVDSIEMAQEYLLPIPQDVRENLMDKYWPGGLTIVLPCNTEKVPSVARGDGLTLGVRQTNHPVLLQILKEIKVPLVAPSANFSGQPTPQRFSDIDPKLLSLVDCVIDEPSGGNVSSTVIDCSVQPWKILREGAVRVDL